MVNDLIKMSRAMDETDDWRRTVEMACLLVGVEFTRQNYAEITRIMLDELTLDEDTLQVSVGDVNSADVIAAAETLKPTPTPDPDPDPEPEPLPDPPYAYN